MTFLLIWCFYSMCFFFFILIKSLKTAFFSLHNLLLLQLHTRCNCKSNFIIVFNYACSALMSCIFSETWKKNLHVCSLYELVNIPLHATWMWWPFFFQWLSTTGLYYWWPVTFWSHMTVHLLKTVISLWKTWLLFQWDIHFKNFDLKLPPPSAYCLWYRQLIIGYQYSIQIFHNLVTHFIIFQHIGTIRWLAVNKNWPFFHFCWVMHDLHSPWK